MGESVPITIHVANATLPRLHCMNIPEPQIIIKKKKKPKKPKKKKPKKCQANANAPPGPGGPGRTCVGAGKGNLASLISTGDARKMPRNEKPPLLLSTFGLLVPKGPGRWGSAPARPLLLPLGLGRRPSKTKHEMPREILDGESRRLNHVSPTAGPLCGRAVVAYNYYRMIVHTRRGPPMDHPHTLLLF